MEREEEGGDGGGGGGGMVSSRFRWRTRPGRVSWDVASGEIRTGFESNRCKKTSRLLRWRCYSSCWLGGLRSHGTPIPLFRSFVRVDVVVDATASYPGFARPWINVWTRLTRLHVPHPALVPQIADLWVVTFLRPVLWRV